MSDKFKKDLHPKDAENYQKNAPAEEKAQREETAEGNWRWVQEDWQRLKGRAHDAWPLLSDSELDAIDGSYDRLVSTVQDRYGIERAAAEAQVQAWLEAI